MARLLPEVMPQRPDVPRPGPLSEVWQRQRLFEALSRAVLALRQPPLLVMDDLQWCDRDTSEWLHFLLRYDRQARFLMVGAYRPGEMDEAHPFLLLVEALCLAGQVTEMDLESLDEANTQTLATRIARSQAAMLTLPAPALATPPEPLTIEVAMWMTGEDSAAGKRGHTTMVVRNDADQPAPRSHLFMLRLWLEDMGSGQKDWRGSVQHVNSGEVRYSRDWPTLKAFVEGLLRSAKPGGRGGTPPEAWPCARDTTPHTERSAPPGAGLSA